MAWVKNTLANQVSCNNIQMYKTRQTLAFGKKNMNKIGSIRKPDLTQLEFWTYINCVNPKFESGLAPIKFV